MAPTVPDQKPASMPGTLAFTAIRNEGPFLLEWIAWYRMLGFENILIAHNDCTDHSPQLLRLLARNGVLSVKRHSPPENAPPQIAGYRAVRSHPLTNSCDWLYCCDIDEFLVVRKGDRTIRALLEGAEKFCCGIAVHWLAFGSDGHKGWSDEFVHQRFLRTGRGKSSQNCCFKSFIYKPQDFGNWRPHGFKDWKGDGTWGEGSNHWVMSDYSPFKEYDPNGRRISSSNWQQITHEAAQLNHYILQSHEQFAFKKGRPSPLNFVDRHTDDFFDRFDVNHQEDRSALDYMTWFDAEYARLVAIPGVLRLHHLCCADYLASMHEKHGSNPRDDPRWHFHRLTAQSLPKPERPT